METKWLQDFLSLAEARNFTRAAASRNTSQAAFSRRIQALEDWLGTTLVDRSAFPTRLTAEGERFRLQAGEILERILLARGDLQGGPASGRIRVALPYAVATGAWPAWWRGWFPGGGPSCQLLPGNVHDMVTSLVAGSVDVLASFHSAQHPIELDPARYDRAVLHTGRLRPYAARGLLRPGEFPGQAGARAGTRIPLLMYPPTVYFGRLVSLAIEQAPVALHGDMRAECEMADVLRGLVLAGQGVAWLPDCALRPGDDALLEPVDDGAFSVAGSNGAFSIDVSIVAFRDHAVRRPAVDRLWSRFPATHTGESPCVMPPACT